MGAVLGAVSPAVVVPRMVQLMEEKRGTDKSIPQLILAGASCDDIFVIVLFTTFTSMAQGGSAHLADFANIPVSIALGVALGAAVGWLMNRFFEALYTHGHCIRNSAKKAVIILGVCVPARRGREHAQGTYRSVRPAGRDQHGMCATHEKPRAGLPAAE